MNIEYYTLCIMLMGFYHTLLKVYLSQLKAAFTYSDFACKIVKTEFCILFCSKILSKIAAISPECSHLANIFVYDFVEL